jgi:type II secretory pathway pseudopilin PulG
MHVHLPKPLHGWRVFFGEVGVVVLGVLIALAAQQAVNDRNERAEARDARRAIQNELATYQARLESRWSIRGCVARRLDEIQTLLDGAEGGGRIDTPKWVGRPQIWTLLTVRWDATSQSGRAALLPAEELADYGLMYA